MNYLSFTVKELYENYLNLYENLYFLEEYRLPYCLIDPQDTVFVCLNDQKIVGIAAVHQKSESLFENLLVETHHDFRKQGIADKLMQLQYQFLQKNNASLLQPKYTDDGQKYLAKKDIFYSKKYNVNLIPLTKTKSMSF